MRTLSAAARAALMAESTSSVFCILIELDHPTFADPIRLVNNNEDLVYGGETYIAYPFRLDPPDEKQDQISNAKITIDNIDRGILAVLREEADPFTIRTKAMFYNDDSSPLFEPLAEWEFTLANASYDAKVITGDLVYEDRLQNRIPALSFTPFDFPGVH
mgnify:CR=1 FL=1